MKKVHDLTDLDSVRQYLNRIGAEARGLKAAVIKEVQGKYWKDIARIKFSSTGEIDAPASYAPDDAEAIAIKAEWDRWIWPQEKLVMRATNLPQKVIDAGSKNIFEFRNKHNQIVMLQVRIDDPKRGKQYFPFTYFDDDIWRQCEPEGNLPLYNAHRLKKEETATVFIHEGAKAARYVQWMVDGETDEARKALAAHPWGTELAAALHIGWIGGALSPSRTDWSALKEAGASRIYIVADNDEPGKTAVPAIAYRVPLPTFVILFTNEFPESFDLADSFPKDMYGEADGVKSYVGPAFRSCLHPATWATDQIPPKGGKGKPTIVLRDSFKRMWAYIEESDLFVCTEMPEILRQEAILNRMLASFSHVAETSRLIVRAYRGRSTRIAYRPDHNGLVVTYKGSSAINLHTPSTIKPRIGDPKPWLEFLEYMFVNEMERREIERWCATIIAQPGIRMGYGLLLASRRQGIGKTTLGASILAPLVGIQNVGFPAESDITHSTFNDWMAHKRLLVINEIYSGSSWKAYNSMKSVITDKEVTVNQKYMRPYVIDNWCHVVACSNSESAFKMEVDDRRWFYPELNEVPWPKEKFVRFRRWIDAGGLGIIAEWARCYNNYVEPSDRAPMTVRKQEMIDSSRSEAQKECAALADVLINKADAIGFVLKDVVEFARHSVTTGKVFDADYELKKSMTDAGAMVWPRRVKLYGRLQYIICNGALWNMLKGVGGDEREVNAVIREHIRKPGEIMEASM